MTDLTDIMGNWGPTIVAAAGATIVAAAGIKLTVLDSWYFNLRKPSWQPPDWLFGPAWTSIFICEAASAVIGWEAIHTAGARALLVVLYVLNGVFNIIWSYYFFHMKRPDFARREIPLLWLSIVALMVMLKIYAGWAWLFLMPYLLWVSFAAFLNHTIVRLNAPFAGRA
ncbi:MAG: tryptophan-rich sensory protein [Acidocella sp.]|nr:tryptophan-rich sensory protein [Acidocella sp.]